jgi:hypothetical protein
MEGIRSVRRGDLESQVLWYSCNRLCSPTGLWDCFQTIGGEVDSRKCPGRFLLEAHWTAGPSAAELIGNGACDLPACGTVPQLLTLKMEAAACVELFIVSSETVSH